MAEKYPAPGPVHPLAARLDALAAAQPGNCGIRISSPRPSGLWQVMAFPDKVETIDSALRELCSTRPEIVIRKAAPDGWLVLACGTGQSKLGTMLVRALADAAAIVAQDDAKVVLQIEGKEVRALLSKGTAVDLYPDRFPVDWSTATLFNHIPVHLTRIGHNAFELIVPRSFAENLLEELMQAGREFGMA